MATFTGVGGGDMVRRFTFGDNTIVTGGACTDHHRVIDSDIGFPRHYRVTAITEILHRNMIRRFP